MKYESALSNAHPIFNDPFIPWCIDMDGTLIREDVTEIAMLESFTNPRFWHLFLWALVIWLVGFSPNLAARFLESNIIPIASTGRRLTFNTQLVDCLKEQQRRRKRTFSPGRRADVVLATASHHLAARSIANHVQGLFDEVLGSRDPALGNLLDASGKEKATLLNSRYPTGFVYAGNSRDDLEVWNDDDCKAMILVNCKPKILQQAQAIGKPFIVIQ